MYFLRHDLQALCYDLLINMKNVSIQCAQEIGRINPFRHRMNKELCTQSDVARD